jgi:hypothetical protein
MHDWRADRLAPAHPAYAAVVEQQRTRPPAFLLHKNSTGCTNIPAVSRYVCKADFCHHIYWMAAKDGGNPVVAGYYTEGRNNAD